ncbi:hypothetical protein [Proteus mirabilis]
MLGKNIEQINHARLAGKKVYGALQLKITRLQPLSHNRKAIFIPKG